MFLLKLLIFLFLTIYWCQTDAQTVYQNKPLNYELTLKKSWLAQGSGRSVNVLAPKGVFDNKIEQINIIVNYTKDFTLDEHFEAFKNKALPVKLKSYRFLREGSEGINGLDARWLECESKIQNKKIINIIYFIEDDGRLYSLRAVALVGTYDKHKQDFLEIIRSFKILQL